VLILTFLNITQFIIRYHPAFDDSMAVLGNHSLQNIIAIDEETGVFHRYSLRESTLLHRTMRRNLIDGFGFIKDRRRRLKEERRVLTEKRRKLGERMQEERRRLEVGEEDFGGSSGSSGSSSSSSKFGSEVGVEENRKNLMRISREFHRNWM
jgi:hypothetical protein